MVLLHITIVATYHINFTIKIEHIHFNLKMNEIFHTKKSTKNILKNPQKTHFLAINA